LGWSSENCQEYYNSAIITYNSNLKYQTIEGIGGFGLRNVNWADPSTWWTDEWGQTFINDFGLSITRNEWYPPTVEGETQDSNWETQKPYMQKLFDLAKASGKPLKQVIAIWSPPAYMKENHSTKNGGRLLPEYYKAFGEWLIECLDSYRNAGIDVYGISLQNEPSAVVEYNSCYYTPQDYVAMVKVVGPILKRAYPNIKIMGPEEMTCETWNWETSYGKALLEAPEALQWIDIIVVHAYTIEYQFGPSDPVIERMHLQQVYDKYRSAGKEIWNTECSCWNNTWQGGMGIAESIYNSFYYGNLSAWLHWLLSGDRAQQVYGMCLTYFGDKDDKYYAARHFARYVRPGAKRIETYCNNRDLLAIAFVHELENTVTFVLINKSQNPTSVRLKGNLQTVLKMEQSTQNEKAINKPPIYSSSTKFTLPPNSITTLYGKIK
jgi:O-glycosyl hydrolase